MSQTLLSILAFVPLVLAGVLLIGFRWPAKYAMPLVFVLTALIGLLAWDMTFNRVLASTLQGLILTAAILWIIFGAILLLNTLKHSSGSSSVRSCCSTRSSTPGASPRFAAAFPTSARIVASRR